MEIRREPTACVNTVLFGLDANTFEKGQPGKTQDVAEFGKAFVALGLTSCWGDVPDPANYTTFNARTFLQPQLNKDGAVYLGAPISHYPEWMTGALGRRREAHATLLERIASFGTSGYGCHHGAMRLLVVCAVRQTGFLSRMMPPSELDPFLEAVDAANISAAFSLLGLDACDQSTPRMEAAIVQMSMPADFGGLNLALLQSEAPAAFYSAQSVVLPKLVREYGPALGPLYEAVRAEVSSVATSALPWAPNYKHRMHTALKNLWASVAIDAGAVLDRDRSGAGDLTLETSGLRPADRSRPSDLTLAGWGGAACDYIIDFACVSSTTPTWSNDPRWCIPGIAATEAEHAKLAADRASSAPVQGVHRYYPFVVEDRGRLGKSALTVVYIFAAVRMAERKTSSLTDRNPKDFILFTKEHFVKEVTIKDNTGAKTYDEEAPFPTLDFPSDHGVVASALRVLMQT
eukprot:jgi/Tetstr1/426808/TSEL_017023.t1